MEARPWAVLAFATAPAELGVVEAPGVVGAPLAVAAPGVTEPPVPTATESGKVVAVLVRPLPLSAAGAPSCAL